jgi:thioredoxin reductase (NADPH)
MYDIIVVGSGPAGLTAAIYARRAEKSVLVIEKETFGGEITHSPKVENYPGFIEMSGNEFADKLIDQATNLGAVIEMDNVIDAEKVGDTFVVTGEYGSYEGRSLIIASGSKHRRLGLEKEDELTGNGVSYCAVCDGPFFKGMEVAIIGGGNSALQEAVMLSEYCTKVTVVQDMPFLTGEKKLQEILEKRDNVEIILGVTVKALEGDEKLTALTLEGKADGKVTSLAVDGAFVAIGQVPENKAFEKLVELDERGYIRSGEDTLTKTEGVFAAGDCRTKAIRQIVTATGDGAVAAVAACKFTEKR